MDDNLQSFTRRRVANDQRYDSLFHSEGHYQNLRSRTVRTLSSGKKSSSIGQRRIAPKPEITFYESPFNLIQPIPLNRERDKEECNISRQSIAVDENITNINRNNIINNRNKNSIILPSFPGAIKRKKHANTMTNSHFKSMLNHNSSNNNRIYTFSILNHIVEQFNGTRDDLEGDETLPFKKSQKFRMRAIKRENGSSNRTSNVSIHSNGDNNNFCYIFNNYI